MLPIVTAALISAGVAAANGIKNANDKAKEDNATRGAINNAIETYKQTEGNAEKMYETLSGNADSMLQMLTELYGTPADAKTNLDEALKEVYGLNPYEASEYSYDKDIADFYDPAFQLSVNMANDGIENSRALGGGLFSSATADALSAQNNVLASNMYDNAVTAMNADRKFDQSVWAGNEQAKQNANLSAQNIANAKLNAASNVASNISSGYGNYYESINNATSNYYDDLNEYAQGLASLEAQKPGYTSGLDRFKSAISLGIL